MVVNRHYLVALIVGVLALNGLGLFEPLLRNDDPLLYAIIAKHIVTTGDWVNLIFSHSDWLDKPHFPFWVTALSFKIFGITSFAYILPGFLFHLLGAYYTYRLASEFYDEMVGLVATLIYVTSFHLILSAIDVRAEAYLLGEIMAACYYWWHYDQRFSLKALLLASFFTGLAMMTKGLFVVVTIFAGLVACWFYTRRYTRILAPRWLLAYACCLVWILPELICLYLQFDAHPEKIIFGRDHVSGLAWYFWGSQFGRFFNSGPIVNTHGNPLFFVHTYLWAFLPWTILFIVSTYCALRYFRQQTEGARYKMVYLLSAFWLTFIMFSSTRFQLDHYTNIIMPFAAIICANYLCHSNTMSRLAAYQRSLSLLLLILAGALLIYLFQLSTISLLALIPWSLALLMLLVPIQPDHARFTLLQFSAAEHCLIWPSLAIINVWLLFLLCNGGIYQKYDVGYNVAKWTNARVLPVVYDYHANWLPLEFYTQASYLHANQRSDLPAHGRYYVFIKRQDLASLNLDPHDYPVVYDFCGNTIDKILPFYANRAKLVAHLECYEVLAHEVN